MPHRGLDTMKMVGEQRAMEILECDLPTLLEYVTKGVDGKRLQPALPESPMQFTELEVSAFKGHLDKPETPLVA